MAEPGVTNEFADPDRSNEPAAVDMAPDQKGTEMPEPAPSLAGAARALSLSHPPSSWSMAAKAEWARIPEHVRADIVAREDAVSAQFREYAGLKPAIRLAADRGVAPADLLSEWTNIENILKYDAESGCRLILKRLAADLRIPPSDYKSWAAALMRDCARAASANAGLH